MARKANETTGKTVEVKMEKPELNESGFYMYIGPNLKGLMETGTILRGTKEEALVKAAQAIEAKPLVKTLIVPGDKLPEARLKVKKPGNRLFEAYKELEKKGR